MNLLHSPSVDEFTLKITKTTSIRTTREWVYYLVLRQDKFIIVPKKGLVQQSRRIRTWYPPDGHTHIN